VIIKHILPEQYGYLSYILQFDEKATKRDLTYMKKLSRQEILHYSQEKGFTPLDTMFAMLKMDKKEQDYLKKSNYKWQSILVKVKELIKTLLRCRHEIFNLAMDLDDSAMEIYKFFKPETIAGFFHNFYRELSSSEVTFYDIYEIKRKEYVFEKNYENEVYALTDSDGE